ncbi:HAD super, subIIIB family protein, partial [Chlamydia psittaci 84-8471/1]
FWGLVWRRTPQRTWTPNFLRYHRSPS